MTRRTAALVLLTLGTAVLGAQTEHRGGGRYTTANLNRPIPKELQNLTDPALNGAIDIHFHVGPDSYPRSIDVLDASKLAQSRGMRGAVIKHHYSHTGGLAYLARKVAPGFEAFGGIALNTPVGGLNVEAIRHMIEVEGSYGKVVWMTTHDSVAEGKADNLPFVTVTKDGAFVQEARDVLAFIAQHQLTLATGHVTPAEQLMVVREAKRLGVQRVVVTHEGSIPGPMTMAQLKEAASLGAFIEVVSGNGAGAQAKAKADRIRELGPEHVIVSSDLGLLGGPLHPDGLAAFAKVLRANGFTERELDLMYKDNPATLLGLPVLRPKNR
jgi:hypothetical protein